MVCAFHGQDPGQLKCLGQESHYFSNNKNAYADILQELIEPWPTDNILNEKEIKLTTNLMHKINCNGEIPLKAKGRSNIYNNGSMPLMLVEIGLVGGDWWKNLTVFSTEIQKTDKPPILLAIMTIDNERQNHRFVVKIGVFLCLGKTRMETERMMMFTYRFYGTPKHAT